MIFLLWYALSAPKFLFITDCCALIYLIWNYFNILSLFVSLVGLIYSYTLRPSCYTLLCLVFLHFPLLYFNQLSSLSPYISTLICSLHINSSYSTLSNFNLHWFLGLDWLTSAWLISIKSYQYFLLVIFCFLIKNLPLGYILYYNIEVINSIDIEFIVISIDIKLCWSLATSGDHFLW